MRGTPQTTLFSFSAGFKARGTSQPQKLSSQSPKQICKGFHFKAPKFESYQIKSPLAACRILVFSRAGMTVAIWLLHWVSQQNLRTACVGSRLQDVFVVNAHNVCAYGSNARQAA